MDPSSLPDHATQLSWVATELTLPIIVRLTEDRDLYFRGIGP